MSKSSIVGSVIFAIYSNSVKMPVNNAILKNFLFGKISVIEKFMKIARKTPVYLLLRFTYY